MKNTLLTIVLSVTCLLAYAQGGVERSKGDNGKWGFRNADDEWVIQPQFDDAAEFYSYPVAAVKKGGKWGYIDIKGNTVLPFIYTTAEINDETYCDVTIKGKHGAVNIEKGVEAAKCLYDKVITFEDTYPQIGMIAFVIKDGKSGMINDEGKEIVPCIYDRGSVMSDDETFLRVKKNKRSGMVNLSGKEIIPCKFDVVSMDDSLFVTTVVGKKKGLYSKDGREIAPAIYTDYIMFDPDGFAVVNLDGKYGLIDRTGKLVLPCKYDNDDAMLPEREKLR